MPITNNKSIIKYIPMFLDYCKKEKYLSPSSIVNYQRFLDVFIKFLKEINKKELLPHQLNKEIISNYKIFISSRLNPNNTGYLRISTQNYYLIALRSLVSFFSEKNIKSLGFNKITLIKEKRIPPEKIILNSEQIEILRSAPDISKINGLRDRTIIELLLSTGLKISQITNINRNQINIDKNSNRIEIVFDNKLRAIFLSNESIYWIKKYLKARNDNENALFVNYQGRKYSSRRLTDRSIERSIRKYVLDNNLPSITPESLRNTVILSLYNKSIKILSPFKHNLTVINSYKYKPLKIKSISQENKKNPKSWYEIEENINKEIIWLKEKIAIMPKKYKNDNSLNICNECLFRKIAILIVSGKVSAVEHKSSNNSDLWGNKTKLLQINRHGQEWHRKTIEKVANYFNNQSCRVILEPTLNYGRADLGIYTQSKNLIITEIGTTSLLKLWYNLSTTKGLTYLIIPYENYIIEFKV